MTTPSDAYRGFAALIPILVISITLVSFTTLVSEDAYALRLSVLRAEYEAAAYAASRSCASSVLLRLVQTPEIPIQPDIVTLSGKRTCTIDRVERFTDSHHIYTSASSGSVSVSLRTEVREESGKMVLISLRKI